MTISPSEDLLVGLIGLVIATPVTACLVVFSSHVPALGAIGQLLGQRPALRPHETLYQRLLANDVDDPQRHPHGEHDERDDEP